MDIQKLLGYSPPHSIALHNAYWVAYFFGPLLVGYWVLKHHGFKATFITGLAIYAAGAMAFWPSSVLHSYAGFFISNFIVGFGLSCVEVAANLFIALAGPGELSEARLNFARGIAAIGMVISPVIVQKALFPGIHQDDLFRIQWYYLGLALFILLLAVVFYYAPLSEASDDDLEAIALQRLYNAGLDKDVKAFRVDARHLLLWSGICVMLIPAGAHEVVSYFWTSLVQDAKPGSDPVGTMAISNTAFACSRFIVAGLCYFGIPPRAIVGVFAFGSILIAVLAMVLPQGPAALTMLILITFFESPLFPTMFGIILRGQGKHTKFAAAALIMGEAGGAIWPSIAFAVDEGNSLSSLIVAVVLWVIALLWSGMLSSTRVTRRWVDPKWSRQRVATGDHRDGETVCPGSADFHTVSERPMAVTSQAASSGRPRQPTLSTVT
jgi:fucose permease